LSLAVSERAKLSQNQVCLVASVFGSFGVQLGTKKTEKLKWPDRQAHEDCSF